MKSCNELLNVLSRHIGKGNGVTASELAALLDITPRQVRSLVTELRMDGKAVCGKPETGYFIAANSEELEETCQFLRSRSLHALTLEARLRRVPLPDLMGQIHLET